MLGVLASVLAASAGLLLVNGYHRTLQPYPFGFTFVNGTVLSHARVPTPCPQCVHYEFRCDFVCVRSDKGCRNALCRDLCIDGDGRPHCHAYIVSILVRTRYGSKTLTLHGGTVASWDAKENFKKNATIVLYLDNGTGLPLNQHILAARVAAAYVLLFAMVIAIVFWALQTTCVRRRVRTPARNRRANDDYGFDFEDVVDDDEQEGGHTLAFVRTKVE